MQYALDPKLLPPGGVRVQCTRCAHVFTAAPPAQANTHSTQVFGGPVPAIAPLTPAAKPANPLNATVIYGAGTKAGAGPKGGAPSATTTQVFGAVPPVPSVAPVAKPAGTKPQAVAKPAGTRPQAAARPAGTRPQPVQAGTPPPSATTTQVFGAVPQPVPPTARPAGNKAQSGGAPAPTTTQVFGAVPQPQPQPPSASTTQVFGAVPGPAVQAQVSSPGPTQPRPEPQQPVAPVAPELPVVGVAATTPIELPDEIPVTRPRSGSIGPAQLTGLEGAQRPRSGAIGPAQLAGLEGAQRPRSAAIGPAQLASLEEAQRPRSAAIGPGLLAGLEEAQRPRSGAFGPTQLADIMADEASAEGLPSASGPVVLSNPSGLSDSSLSDPPLPGPSVSALSKPLELPPELLEEPLPNDKPPGSGRSEPLVSGRVLLIAVGVLVLILTAFLTSPAWLGKSNTVPQEAVVAKDSALAVLRRDDTASKVEALASLKALADAHPQSIEMLAEWATALAMHLDDTRVEAATIQARVDRLNDEISALSEAKAPADWSSRVNLMREEVEAKKLELTPLEERAAALSKDAVQVLKRLAAAPEKEEPEASLVRLRARALLSAVLGAGESLTQAIQLAQAEQRDWSELVVAEYVLNGTAPPAQAAESFAAMGRLRERNSSFLRTYVLGARIAVLRGELETAQGLLDAVITLNPKHELAHKLQAHVRDLALEKSEGKSSP